MLFRAYGDDVTEPDALQAAEYRLLAAVEAHGAALGRAAGALVGDQRQGEMYVQYHLPRPQADADEWAAMIASTQAAIAPAAAEVDAAEAAARALGSTRIGIGAPYLNRAQALAQYQTAVAGQQDRKTAAQIANEQAVTMAIAAAKAAADEQAAIAQAQAEASAKVAAQVAAARAAEQQALLAQGLVTSAATAAAQAKAQDAALSSKVQALAVEALATSPEAPTGLPPDEQEALPGTSGPGTVVVTSSSKLDLLLGLGLGGAALYFLSRTRRRS